MEKFLKESLFRKYQKKNWRLHGTWKLILLHEHEINTTPQLWKILYLHYLGYAILPMKGYWV